MRQRGFVPSPLLIASIVILILGAGLAIQTKRVESCKADYARFVAEVKTIGVEAEKKAKAQEAIDLKAKEKSDAQAKSDRTRIAMLSKRLRDANSRSSTVSQLPLTTNRPDLSAFDRAELDRAIRDYQSEILGLIEKGAEAIVDLDVAKEWIKEVK